MANKLVMSNEYQSFRNAVPLKRVILDEADTKVWSFYDAGPKSIKCPILCLPPAAGKADAFFRQLLGLSGIGCRTIALDYPVCWNVEEFCIGLRKVIDHLHLDQVHIFGCSLGAYLALKFTERMRNTAYVASLILCNGFTDTSVFKYTRASSAFWLVPAFILKRLVMGNLSKNMMDAPQADATDFVVECLESLAQKEIASRLVLHCNGDYLRKPHTLQHIPVTIMDVFDESALSQGVKDDMYKSFPNAKRAHLKTGGNFPYLSRSAEVNLHLRIHLKQFEGTKSSAKELCSGEPEPSKSRQSYQEQPLMAVREQNADETKAGSRPTLSELSRLQQEQDQESDLEIEPDENDVIDFPI